MAKKKKKKSQNPDTVKVMGSVLKKMGIDMREDVAFMDPDYYVSTGSIGLNNIVSDGGGIPPGIVEIFGPEGVGKTTLALGIVAQAQEIGLDPYVFDVENKLHGSMVKTIHGLDPTKVKWPETENGTQVVKALDVILPQCPRSIIVIDSIPAMITEAQFREGSDKDNVAPIPRLLGNILVKARTWTRRNKSLLILLNQEREAVNTMGYGPRSRTPGGRALKHYCDIRLHLKVIEKLKKNEEIIGQRLKVTTQKNSMARPFQSANVALIYGHGIDTVYELYELGIQFGLIQKSGGWLDYNGHKVQGSDRLVAILREDPELLLQLATDIKDNI
jgi:recombination protein RecA